MKRFLSAALIVTAVALSAFGCASTQVASTDAMTGAGIKGQVQFEGQGAEGAYVYAYDATASDLRGMTKLVSTPTKPDGSYSLDLPPGSYTIVARKRASGSAVGALAEGDLEGRYPAGPVTVKAGEQATVDFAVDRLPGLFLLRPTAYRDGGMGFSGKVVREDGTPASGVYVMVYTRRDRIGRPAYLSQPTNAKGEYALYLTKPGTYYVSARTTYGDLPRKGEPYGTYDQNPEHKILIADSTVLAGIDITISKFTRDLTKCAEH